MIHPTVIKESGTRLTISGKQYEQLVKKPQAVLWSRDGMYGLIPVSVIKNAIQLDRDCAQVQEHAERYVDFLWDETLEIPPETGNALERDG